MNLTLFELGPFRATSVVGFLCGVRRLRAPRGIACELAPFAAVHWQNAGCTCLNRIVAGRLALKLGERLAWYGVTSSA